MLARLGQNIHEVTDQFQGLPFRTEFGGLALTCNRIGESNFFERSAIVYSLKCDLHRSHISEVSGK